MAQVKIDDVVVLPQTETETNAVCHQCSSETKKDEVDAGDSAAKPLAEPKVENAPSTTSSLTHMWMASKRWMQENDRLALLGFSIVGLYLAMLLCMAIAPRIGANVWHEKSAPIEALRCIRIHHDPFTGGMACVNWDIKSVPLVGARRIMPDAVDGYNEHLVELYAYDSDARFAVYTPDEFKRISIVVQNGIKNGKSVTRYELIVTGPVYDYYSKPLGDALADRLIVATVAKDANRWREATGEDWMQQLIRTILDNFPSTDFSMGCESRQVYLGEISLSTSFFGRPVDNVLSVGKRMMKVSPEVYQALIQLSRSGNWTAEQWYTLTGMSIKATVTMTWSLTAFKVAVQLPVAKYCSRMNQ